jgi:hypothetical protein
VRSWQRKSYPHIEFVFSPNRVADGAPDDESDGGTDPNLKHGESGAQHTLPPLTARMAKHEVRPDTGANDATDDHSQNGGPPRPAVTALEGEIGEGAGTYE